jgi:hypothetical protein
LNPRVPWLVLNVVASIAAACLLWAFSVPGFVFLLVLGLVHVLGLAAVAWVVLVVMGDTASTVVLVVPAGAGGRRARARVGRRRRSVAGPLGDEP